MTFLGRRNQCGVPTVVHAQACSVVLIGFAWIDSYDWWVLYARLIPNQRRHKVRLGKATVWLCRIHLDAPKEGDAIFKPLRLAKQSVPSNIVASGL